MTRLFSSQFPLDNSKSLDDLFLLDKLWVVGSPVSPFKKIKELDGLQEHENAVAKETPSGESYTTQLAMADAKNHSFLGFRYRHPGHDGSQWCSDVIGAKNDDSFWVSVTVDYEVDKSGKREPYSKRPYILKLLAEKMGGRDGNVPITGRPYFFEDEGGVEDFVAEMMTGQTDAVMPIVYMSKDRNNFLSLDPETLADKLAGLANVLVEPSRDFSHRLKKASRGNNVYFGAVGIYWPEGYGKYVLTKKLIDSMKYPNETIVRKVIDGLRSRRISRHLTWNNIHIVHNQQAMEELQRTSVDTESQELAQLYAEERDRKEAQLEEAEQKVRSLEARLRALSIAKPVQQNGEVIQLPTTDELYEGEFRRVIVDALQGAMRTQPDRITRRKALLDEMLELNQLDDNMKAIVNRLKVVLRNYDGMTAPIKSELERKGFRVVKGGDDHYIVSVEGFRDDVFFELASSPGFTGKGGRSGPNAASGFIRMFFK